MVQGSARRDGAQQIMDVPGPEWGKTGGQCSSQSLALAGRRSPGPVLVLPTPLPVSWGAVPQLTPV
jgi:hypothetical protein